MPPLRGWNRAHYGLLGCPGVPDWVGAPDVQKFLVARSHHGNIFLAGYAIQRRAEIRHLLAIQAAERNFDGLLRVQLRKVGQNVGHRFAVFSLATQRNVGPAHGRVVGVRSLATPVPLSSHKYTPFANAHTPAIVCQKFFPMESYYKELRIAK